MIKPSRFGSSSGIHSLIASPGGSIGFMVSRRAAVVILGAG
jgi:hypothetical protein